MVVSLPSSFGHVRIILLYSNADTLLLQDVIANLLYKEKFDLDMHVEKNLRLYLSEGDQWGKIMRSKKNFHFKSRRRKNNKFCKYYKNPRNDIFECWKLKYKKEK